MYHFVNVSVRDPFHLPYILNKHRCIQYPQVQIYMSTQTNRWKKYLGPGISKLTNISKESKESFSYLVRI